MEGTAVTIRVPATSANLGPGFDALGMALDMFASVTVTFAREPLPTTEDVAEKMVLSAVRHAYRRLEKEPPPGVMARYTVAVPVGRGLGASAVARVAGVLAVNELERHPFDQETILALVAELEGHADNACAALFGGIQVCVQDDDGRYLTAPCRYPPDLEVALLIPDASLPTREARRVLPESYRREDVVFNLSRVALFVAALASNRLELLAEATRDRLHQPYRQPLFPPMEPVFEAAREAGALAVWLSGAGSTIAALCRKEGGRAVAAAMRSALQSAGEQGRSLVTHIAPRGAEVARVELVEL